MFSCFFLGICSKCLHFIHSFIKRLTSNCLGCIIYLHRLDFPTPGHWALNTTAFFLNAVAFFKNAVMFFLKDGHLFFGCMMCRKYPVYHTPLLIVDLQLVFWVYEMQVVFGNLLYIRARV